MGPRFVHLGNHRMTTPFSLGNTRPSERKSCFSGNHWATTLFSLGNTRPSERKVGFRWTLSHDDPVLSWKHATLREKSRVPVDPIAVDQRNAFLCETRDPPRESRVSVETIGRRPCFLLETRDPPRDKSGSGGLRGSCLHRHHHFDLRSSTTPASERTSRL
jgi:hypothetical protein